MSERRSSGFQKRASGRCASLHAFVSNSLSFSIKLLDAYQIARRAVCAEVCSRASEEPVLNLACPAPLVPWRISVPLDQPIEGACAALCAALPSLPRRPVALAVYILFSITYKIFSALQPVASIWYFPNGLVLTEDSFRHAHAQVRVYPSECTAQDLDTNVLFRGASAKRVGGSTFAGSLTVQDNMRLYETICEVFPVRRPYLDDRFDCIV